ncbi:MAG TPA: YdcF family protein [Rhodospirillaceae bacterium]|nr:hypothetical protein [Rhodospirillaceae bacterium]HAA92520.1 YdcF family protein [Rhodospirillaceae bacterium]HAT35413.1 YdcF family protein [Rhodospirillaceae bacterium]
MSATFFINALLKAVVLPPGGNIFVILFGLLIRRRHPFIGAALIFLSTLGLFAFSTPMISNSLMLSLAQHKALVVADAKRGEAIVLLSGGLYRDAPEYGRDSISSSSLFRARYAAYLHKRTDLPIAVVGGKLPNTKRSEASTIVEVLRDDFHIEVKWREDSAEDTWSSAARLAPMLAAEGVKRIVLVTHLLHMPRAELAFERKGFEVLAAPTGFISKPGFDVMSLLPSAGALSSSSWAMKEWFGRLVYRIF